MDKSLIANGFVVINNGLDLSNLNSYWLVSNDILKEEDLNRNHVFTNNFIQINLNKYTFTLNNNSIILTINNNYSEQDYNEGVEKLIFLLKKIKNTTNLSCGINFNWVLDGLKDDEYFELSKKLFFVKDNALYEDFADGSPCFGAYMSKDFQGSRLKLDIKPIHSPEDKKLGTLHFNFNFHRDLIDSSSLEELSNYLIQWKIYKDKSESLVIKI